MRIPASELDLESLGDLDCVSSWSPRGYNLRFSDTVDQTVVHKIAVPSIEVDPEDVLYWQRAVASKEIERPNSTKRFGYMLGNRALAELISINGYVLSLVNAVIEQGVRPPSGSRLDSLARLAGKYIQMTSGEKPSLEGRSLRTNTARILFNYNPPKGQDLTLLHDYILEKHNNSE
jgi:hypothetical protein